MPTRQLLASAGLACSTRYQYPTESAPKSATTRPVPNGTPLPDEIVLTHQEAATVLFVLDAAMETAGQASELYLRLEGAARIIVEKFLPDLPDL